MAMLTIATVATRVGRRDATNQIDLLKSAGCWLTRKNTYRKVKNAETSTDSAPPPCKAGVQQQQHKASLQRVVTSADMKAEDVDQATPITLTPGQRVATWS